MDQGRVIAAGSHGELVREQGCTRGSRRCSFSAISRRGAMRASSLRACARRASGAGRNACASARSASPSPTSSARCWRRRSTRAEPRSSTGPGMGNTGILYAALKSGAIDLYPEYTGTIAREILKVDGDPRPGGHQPRARAAGPGRRGAARLQQQLRARDARRPRAGARHPHACRTSRKHAGLKLGLSQEFIGRADGWPGLKAAYRLPYATPSGLDHGLAYEAIAAGQDRRDGHLLDRRQDRALPAARARGRPRLLSALRRGAASTASTCRSAFPTPRRALQALEGKNRRAQHDPHERRGRAGRQELRARPPRCLDRRAVPQSRGDAEFPGRALRPRFLAPHAASTCCSCSSRSPRASSVGVPLGVLVPRRCRRPRRSRCSASSGVIQTIPSLALLAFLIALAGRDRHRCPR